MNQRTFKLLTKKQAETNKVYGINPDKRPLKDLINNGIVIINKPQGPTSHQVSDYVKKILNISKAGHSGTLDPNVTGVLPVALAKSTKILEYFFRFKKEYIALMYVHKDFDRKELEKIIEKFKGKIKQIPPLKSAVKRVERTREIYYLDILETEGRNVLLRVGCEAGTYIRTLCHGIGKELKTGAHMSQLIRTKSGPFTDKDWHSLYDLKDALEFSKENESEIRKIIIPVEKAIDFIPKIYVLDSAVDPLCHGSELYSGGISKLDSDIKEKDDVAILTLKGELVAVGKSLFSSEDLMNQLSGTSVKTNKVFMEQGTYPKYEKES
ncbi:MAG: RNA-guided pseudouridylation complex pseudouridine synthase subunit Cbf5 [Candidatus Nanoarchaeia archaeon]|nr:RNA-guided pseudouridylation complex pseudouridine synthase subunit Cbf5 [Candidatus Nanoarchaeia archaeon]